MNMLWQTLLEQLRKFLKGKVFNTDNLKIFFEMSSM